MTTLQPEDVTRTPLYGQAAADVRDQLADLRAEWNAGCDRVCDQLDAMILRQADSHQQRAARRREAALAAAQRYSHTTRLLVTGAVVTAALVKLWSFALIGPTS